MTRRHRPKVALMLLVAALAALSIRLPMAAADRATDYALFDPLIDIHHLLSRHFFQNLDDDRLKDMQLGAINGMLDVLDDPYTEFIPNEDIDDFDKVVRGEYAGIGAQVDSKDGYLRIVTPMEDSPAYRAGIEADDLVVAVDGKGVFGMATDPIIDRLTGEPGTTVRLTVQRVGGEADQPMEARPASAYERVDNEPDPPAGSVRFDIELVRQKIVTSTVKGIHRVGDRWSYFIDPERKIGYIRVTQFTEGTLPELEAALRTMIDGGMRGLILDLRFNGGGALRAAIEMADLFLKEGTIVSTKGRTTREDRAIAQEDGTLPDFPMIVVLNGQSASASEVVSGALADNGRAVILGERSFGKGIVQALYRLPSGTGQLKVTEQYYYLPSGRCLHRLDDSSEWGVDPTPGFYVPMTIPEQRAMLRIRRDEEIIRNGEPDPDKESKWSDPQWILDYLKDAQLSAATLAMRGKLDSGEWVPTGQEAPKGTLERAELEREERTREYYVRALSRTEKRIAALSSGAAEPVQPVADLIPGQIDLTGGKVEIRDKDGNLITTLRITDSDLEAWLEDAPVAPDMVELD